MVADRPAFADSESPETAALSTLRGFGIDAILVTEKADLDSVTAHNMPKLALLDVASMRDAALTGCVRRCIDIELPVIALVPPERVVGLDVALGVDDFVLTPPRADELVARARRVLSREAPVEDSDLIRAGDLTINPANYEVSLKGDRVNLRFKEYELLMLLARNPGRVFSREALMSRIWGYDYFGGIRTVDVHIRRLRSKLQDAEHPLIETVWKAGYRFRDVRRPA